VLLREIKQRSAQ